MSSRPKLCRGGESRGVSEVVSFLLIFSILLSISITGAVFGIESLENASHGKERHVAKASLEHLRADMYDLSDGAAYRATEIEMVDGSLRYGEPITITVDANAATDSMESIVIRPRPIIYDLGQIEVVYVSGAILLEQPDGGVMETGPLVRIDDEQVILPMLNTSHQDGPAGVGGSGVAYVVGYRFDESIRRYEPTDASGSPIDATVTVTIETPRTKQWKLYFESDPRFENVVVNEGESTVKAEFVTKRLYITVTRVNVRLEV